jgi:hypothetical protein
MVLLMLSSVILVEIVADDQQHGPCKAVDWNFADGWLYVCPHAATASMVLDVCLIADASQLHCSIGPAGLLNGMLLVCKFVV